ncbi:hypothetical protein M2284_004560, partial [Rhodococcus sp. LBL1]|nr:hypothetical protein [Rhodococcus sp. LBL1]MDH6685763.1 hypothetical protein [Rhodococcus sp. LBL2]
MQNPLLRRCATPITGAALVAGTMLIGGPAGADTATVNFKNTCAANAIITVDKTADTGMQVDAPAAVTAGETFTYRIQPGPGSFPNSDSGATTNDIVRMKVDYAIPDNATFVSASVVSGSGINVDTANGETINALRVNDAGSADVNGGIVRLSGNNQLIGNSPSSGTSDAGMRVRKTKTDLNGNPTSGDTWFRLPAIDITVTANAPGVVQPKVRTTPAATAGTYNKDENYYSFLAKSSLGNAKTRCTPRDTKSSALNAGAGALATINVTASQVSTTTNLTAPSTAETGAQVTLTANVAPTNATGSVQFQDNGNNIGSPVAVSGGAASLNHTFASAGSHSITAVFTATGSFTGSTSAAQTVTVSDPTPVDVTTTLGLTVPQNAETGAAVNLTAAVTPSNAAGTVQFKDNGNNIGTPVTVAAGAATLSHTFANAGAHAITADFVGATGFAGSTAGAQTVTVTDPVVPDTQTTTTVTAPATAETGGQVTLSATVAPVPSGGSVQFKVAGSAVGSPVNVDNAGHASMPYTFNAAGSYAVTAEYSGTTGFTASTASASNVTVSDPAPQDVATTLGLQVPATAETGASVNLTATVTPSDAAGTVQFKSNGNNIGSPVTVSGGTAVLSHAFDAAGAQAITADFTGATGFKNSAASSQTVSVSDPAPQDVATTLALQVPATAETGASVNLTATVTPSNAAGAVQFKSNGANIGSPVTVSGGTAVLSHAFGAAGAQAITADFTGGAGFLNSAASSQTVSVSDPAPQDVATTLALQVPATA